MNVLVEHLAYGRFTSSTFREASFPLSDAVGAVRHDAVLAIARPWQEGLLPTDDPRNESLNSAYLGVVELASWERSTEQAREHDGPAADIWVTIVPAGHGFGLTLPQDSSSTAYVAGFSKNRYTGATEVVRLARNGRVEVISADGSTHCDFPDRGECSPGQCGDCELRRRVADPPGYICVCPHA